MNTARKEWKRMSMSNTPKFHLMLDHASESLLHTGGYVDMGEDCIEQSHQTRVRDEARLIRLRNENQVKMCQAKYQHTRMIKEVQDIQEQVYEASKRTMKRGISLKEEHAETKRQKRVSDRTKALVSTKAQYTTKQLFAPRKILKNQMKKHMEEQKEENNNEWVMLNNKQQG